MTGITVGRPRDKERAGDDSFRWATSAGPYSRAARAFVPLDGLNCSTVSHSGNRWQNSPPLELGTFRGIG